MKTVVPFAAAALCAASVLLAQDARLPHASAVKVVQGDSPAQDYRQCRRMLVGPGVNQPDPYPGYRGFVGWQSPIVLQDRTMLVGFSSGYWHASPPTAYFAVNPAAMEQWKKIGMPTDIDAPRGGRAEIIRSTDRWEVMVPDPRSSLTRPGTTALPTSANCRTARSSAVSSRTLARRAADLTRDPDKTTLTGIIRSFDNGRTWEHEPKRLPSSVRLRRHGWTDHRASRRLRTDLRLRQRPWTRNTTWSPSAARLTAAILGSSLDRVNRPRDVRDGSGRSSRTAAWCSSRVPRGTSPGRVTAAARGLSPLPSASACSSRGS